MPSDNPDESAENFVVEFPIPVFLMYHDFRIFSIRTLEKSEKTSFLKKASCMQEKMRFIKTCLTMIKIILAEFFRHFLRLERAEF